MRNRMIECEDSEIQVDRRERTIDEEERNRRREEERALRGEGSVMRERHSTHGMGTSVCVLAACTCYRTPGLWLINHHSG